MKHEFALQLRAAAAPKHTEGSGLLSALCGCTESCHSHARERWDFLLKGVPG